MKKLVLAGKAKADLEGLDRTPGIDPPEFRLRVGDFRVRFSYLDADTVSISRVQNRKDAYR